MNGKKEIIFAFYLKLQCIQTQTSKNTKNECRRNPCWPRWEQLTATTTDCTTAVQTTQFWPVWVTTGQCGTLYSRPYLSLWLQLYVTFALWWSIFFFFIIPVQFNVFLPCVFPCAAVTTVGINKVSCLVQKKRVANLLFGFK